MKRTLLGILVMVLLVGIALGHNVAVQASTEIGTPTGMKVKNTEIGADLKVTWKKVGSASGYDVYMATSKSGKYKHVKTTTGTSFTTSKVKRDKMYYFKVRAYKTIVTTEPVATAKPKATAEPIATTEPIATAEPVATTEPTVIAEPAVTATPVVKKEKRYSGYSIAVSGKTCKYLLNTVIDNGGQDVYFYWLWDGKTAVKDNNYWATTSKCEKILRERYSNIKKKTIVGALNRYRSVRYPFNGKIVCIATPWLELGPGGGDSNPDSE